MTAWWTSLSQRERLIVGGGGIIVAFVALFQLVLAPIGDWREKADQRADAAQQGYEMVARAAAVGGLSTNDDANTIVPLRQALTQTAAAAEIQLIRVGTETDGQIEVQLAPVDAVRLFNWMATLQRQFAVRVAFADIARADEGIVNAQVLVFER